MHSLGLLHADMKSLNVFVSSGMDDKIGDFGCTCKAGKQQVTGTPAWMAPELLEDKSYNTYSSDMYAVGMTLWELWTCRQLFCEYDDLELEIFMTTLTRDVCGGKRPDIREHEIPTEIKELIVQCWRAEPEKRLDALQLDNSLTALAGNVEFKSKYEESKDEEAASLLYKILPAQIADQVKRGEQVEPIHCDVVTILFSDIVGFTEISSKLSSQEVMEMLQRLYVEFDNLTTKHKLFKVETIGDAYMVCGGLFNHEDVQSQMIVRQGIEMIRAAAKIPVHKDRPEMGTIRIRVGAHSGPVVASVVGQLNPRFCLFGDTVNHASRMESNSIVQRFQISADLKQRLAVEAPEFNIALRGQIPIKGKGMQWTYWVEGTNPKQVSLQEEFPPPKDPLVK